MNRFLFAFVCMLHVCVFGQDKPQPASKTVFITGGTGFIGCNFLSYMFDKHPNYHFIVLDALTYASTKDCIPDYIQESPRFQFVHGTILDSDTVDSLMAQADFVVHFAAETDVTRSIHDDLVFVTTNVMGTRTLLQSLLKHQNTVERFVHISSSEVYGTAETHPMDENHPLNPRSPYAASKTGAERLVYSYCCTYDIPAVIVRPFNNYGPNQHIEKMLPRFITSAIKQAPLCIEGTGLQKRDWVYTYDIADAIDRILHMPNFDLIKHETINLGTGQATSVLEIAQMVLDYFGLPYTYLKFVKDRPGQVDTHISSTDKAFEKLGWKAQTPFSEGLKNTIEWYISHRSAWDTPCLTSFLSNPSESVEMQ